MREIRIGFIGAGENTRLKHLPGFLAIPGVRAVAVCNRSRASGERVAREFGIGRVEEDWRAIVDAPDIDAVCIGTWPNLHATLSIAALRAGKHVLTEARMARDFAEASAMLAAARSHPELVAQIVPAPFSLPFDCTARDWLEAGELGTIREVHATCTHAGLIDASASFGWRQDFDLSGKNTLFLGIYYEMVLRWLRSEPEWVMADAAVFTPTRRDATGVAREVKIPESVTVLGRYPDGARLRLHCSGVESAAPRQEIRVNGTRAGLRADFAANALWLTPRGGKERQVEIAAGKEGAWRVEADFIAGIRDGRAVQLTDFATGSRYMAFTDAVWESWNNGGRRVALPV